jgi:hypothetical protein
MAPLHMRILCYFMVLMLSYRSVFCQYLPVKICILSFFDWYLGTYLLAELEIGGYSRVKRGFHKKRGVFLVNLRFYTSFTICYRKKPAPLGWIRARQDRLLSSDGTMICEGSLCGALPVRKNSCQCCRLSLMWIFAKFIFQVSAYAFKFGVAAQTVRILFRQ